MRVFTYALGIAVTFSLTDCDGMGGYSKPGASRSEFERDAHRCMETLGIAADQGMSTEERIAQALEERGNDLDACMRQMGWRSESNT